MIKNTWIRLSLLALISTGLSLQATAQSKKQQKKEIVAVLNRFFDGLATGDTMLIKNACVENPVFQTIKTDKDGKIRVADENFKNFVQTIGKPRKDKYEEKIEVGNVSFEAALASVWTPYTFYVNDKVSHCGTNSFQLVKMADGWKIQYIIDTRRKDCD